LNASASDAISLRSGPATATGPHPNLGQAATA
jgi:hypothetical protein